MAEINSYPNNQDVYRGAEEVMRWFHGRTSGVYGADDNAAVTAVQSNMAVQVSDGYGWISNDAGDGVVWWIDNEKKNGVKLQLTVDPAEGTLNRVDRVVIEWPTTNYVGLPEVKILKGSAASSATAPTLTNNSTVRQISLARITINAGTTALTPSMITDERLDPAVCGIVTEQVELDTTTMQDQFQSLLVAMSNELAELKKQVEQAASGSLIDKSVTRAKLAPDALYSPNVLVSVSRALTADDIGKTLFASGANNDCTFALDSTVNKIMPSGAEIAFCWINTSSPVSIYASDIIVVHAGDGKIDTTSIPVTFKLSEVGTMVALKKYSSTTWVLTGNVEVVT